jgi:hypothetical protein
MGAPPRWEDLSAVSTPPSSFGFRGDPAARADARIRGMRLASLAKGDSDAPDKDGVRGSVVSGSLALSPDRSEMAATQSEPSASTVLCVRSSMATTAPISSWNGAG